MIRFAFGLALLTLAVIIGSFRFFENRELVEKLNKQLVKAEATQLEARRLESRVMRTKELVLKRGQDQLSAVQRVLGLDKLRSLEFKFVSETSPTEQGNRYFYQHGFEIEGLVNFFDAAQLIDRIDSTPGFTLNFICFKCKALPEGREAKPDEYMLTLRGTIYVYNDSRI